jgi:hypothetical protein|tara:strand:+ start:9540 stop:9734 length:195 start_codon:yes stop_codon:yes gene_type:complete
MKNITELRDELALMFDQLISGDLEPKAAKELNNAAGKIINSCKVQLEYQGFKTTTPEIKFLDGE